MRKEEIINTFIENLKVEVESLINAESVCEEERIIGRIEATANIVRFIKNNLSDE